MTKRTTLYALLLTILSVQGFKFLIDTFDSFIRLNDSLYFFINYIWIITSGIWAFLLLRQLRDKDYWQFKLNWPNLGYVLISFILIHIVFLFSNIFFPMPVNTEGLSEAKLYTTGLESVFLALNILIIAPVCEELVHRGVVMTLGDNYTKGKLGWLLSSITFSLIHLPYYDMRLTDFIHYVAIGLVFGWVYKKSNSIYWSIIAHITWNTFVFLVTRG